MSEKLCFKLVLLMWWTMSIFSFIGHILTELFGKTDNWQKIYKQTSLTFYTSNNVPLKWVEKKKLLGCNSKEIKNLLNFTTLQNGCLISFKKMCSWNWKKVNVSLYIKKTGFFKINIKDTWKFILFVFISWLVCFGADIYIPQEYPAFFSADQYIHWTHKCITMIGAKWKIFQNLCLQML